MCFQKLTIPREISSIYVGFSGGADSTALLLILAKQFPKQVTAIHFNHGLREESAEEEVWCKKLCSVKNINFQSFDLNVPKNSKNGESVESAARRLRLESWYKIVANPKSSLVALAHHRDDLNENFLIRLMRGSGLSGLTGLREFTTIDGTTFWRPLLKFPKSKLTDYLKNQHVTDWCEDASNRENIYRRNSIRNQLIPLFSEIAGGTHALENSIQKLTEEADFLDQLATVEFNKIKEANEIKNWQNIPKPLLHRVFRLFIKNDQNCDFITTNATVDRIYQEIQSATASEKTVPLDNNLNLVVSTSGLKIFTQKDKNYQVNEITWNPLTTPEFRFGKYRVKAEVLENFPKKDKNYQLFDLDKLSLPLTIRNVQPGDRIKTFGGMNKKVKNIFINQKIPRNERTQVPLIINNSDIIWIAGITRSNYAPITDKTAKIIKLTIQQN